MGQLQFTKIAAELKQRAADGTYGETASLCQNLITQVECQTRWEHLDASNWCEPAPDSTSFDAVHKIYINPAVISNGHGSQPSYDQLRSISAGSAPSYLRAPMQFPSTSAATEGIEDEEDLDTIPMQIPSLSEAIAKLVSLD